MVRYHSLLWPGVPLALASALLFGLSAPLSKLLLGSVDPWVLAGIQYLGAGLGLGALLLWQQATGRQSEARIAKREWPLLLLIVAIGGGIAPVLLMYGLSATTASSGSLLLNLEGLATMLIAWVMFRENVDRRLLLGALAILAGGVLLAWRGGSVSFDLGALLIAGACVAWGIDNNLSRKLSSADPVQIVVVKGLVAGSANLVLGISLGAAVPAWPTIAAGAALGLMSVGISLVLFMLALRHLGAARTSAYFSLAPFVGALVAIAMGDPVTFAFALAASLMAVGLFVHLAERHEHMHTHQAIEHEHSHVHDAHHQHSHDGPVTEPHSHRHRHEPLRHSHPHYPDLHHRHSH